MYILKQSRGLTFTNGGLEFVKNPEDTFANADLKEATRLSRKRATDMNVSKNYYKSEEKYFW